MSALYGIPVVILKEGTQRTYGREALRNNVIASRALAEILKTSLGPRGMDKMLVDSFGDVTVTNDGAAIVKEMEIQHPAAKLLVEVAKATDAEVGDGTTSAVVLAGELLSKAEALLDQNIHPTIIIEGYKKAAAITLNLLDELGYRINVQDLETPEGLEASKRELRNVVHSVLASKYVATPDIIDYMVDLSIEAALKVAEKKSDGTYNVRLDNVKIEKKKGASLAETRLISGLVLDKEVVHPGMPKRVEKAKIALIDAPLEIEKPDITAKINITSPDQIKTFLDEETKVLKDMVERIASSGAAVVVCQKGIDDVAQHFLAKKGILAVRRVKRSDMEKLERATGGRIVTSIRDLTSNDLGYAELVEERRVGNEKMLFVEGCKNPKAVTILIRGSSDMILDDMERSFNDALHSLRNILRDPKIVPGGGSIEVELALRLRKKAEEVSGKEQLAVQAFADALEEISSILAQSAGMDPLQTIMELRRLHSEGKTSAGVEVLSGKIIEDMMGTKVIDPVIVKKQVIKAASEAATAILKVDDVIAASPMKKEEKGKEGLEGPEAGKFGGLE
ncbi:MAG: thermosome subunit alpha [Zestosphaera sp.]